MGKGAGRGERGRGARVLLPLSTSTVALQVSSDIVRPSVRPLASWNWTGNRLDRKSYGHCVILVRDDVVSIAILVEGKPLGTEVTGDWFSPLFLLFPVVVGGKKDVTQGL